MSELDDLTKALQMYLEQPIRTTEWTWSHQNGAKVCVYITVRDMVAAERHLSTPDLFEMRKHTGINLAYASCRNVYGPEQGDIELTFVSLSDFGEIMRQARKYLERIADFEVRKLLASSV